MSATPADVAASIPRSSAGRPRRSHTTAASRPSTISTYASWRPIETLTKICQVATSHPPRTVRGLLRR